jgi:hypothetical protein
MTKIHGNGSAAQVLPSVPTAVASVDAAIRSARVALKSTTQSTTLKRRATAPARSEIIGPPNSPTSQTRSHPHSRPFSWSRCAWVTCPTSSEPTPTVAPVRAAVGFRGRDAIRTFSPSIRPTSPFSQTAKQRGNQMSDLSDLHGIYPTSLRWNAESGFLAVSAFNGETGERELRQIELGQAATFVLDLATRERGYGLIKSGVYDMKLSPVGRPPPPWPENEDYKPALSCRMWNLRSGRSCSKRTRRSSERLSRMCGISLGLSRRPRRACNLSSVSPTASRNWSSRSAKHSICQ